MKQKLISAKEIIGKHHLTYQTINHYTNFGLLSVVTKKMNARLYDEEQIEKRLAKISELASRGFSLRLIRQALDQELTVSVPRNNKGNP